MNSGLLAWIVVLVIAGPALLAVVIALWLDRGHNREVATGVEVLNPGGDAGTAFVVYHPGRSDFQRRVFSGFMEGLVANGWRVESTSPSIKTPTDLSGYDLLVLGGPTYWFTPNRPIRRYLSRLGDLGGRRVVTLITALGMGERSASIMERLVLAANGDLVKSLLLYKMRPNDENNQVGGEENRALAVAMATQAAKEIPRPGSGTRDTS